MLERLLAFLAYQPNFTRDWPTWLWPLLVVALLWQGLVSWRIFRRTGLRSYAWGGLGAAFMLLGCGLAPLGRSVLYLALAPLPLLLVGFLVTSVSDARAWFSDEAGDKFYLLRRGGLPLRWWGRIPGGFVRHEGQPGGTRRQGLVVSMSTVVFVGAAFGGALHAQAVEAITDAQLAVIGVTVGAALFHALAMGVFALVYGADDRPARCD